MGCESMIASFTAAVVPHHFPFLKYFPKTILIIQVFRTMAFATFREHSMQHSLTESYNISCIGKKLDFVGF